MRALDILAVVSGVAGIASFAVTLLDRFSQWRRYLVPVSAFLLGYALSAASMLLFPSMAMGVSHEHSWPVIIIILALVAALVGCGTTDRTRSATLLATEGLSERAIEYSLTRHR